MSWGGRPHQPAKPAEQHEVAPAAREEPAVPSLDRGRAETPGDSSDAVDSKAETAEYPTGVNVERQETAAPAPTEATIRGRPVMRAKRPLNVENLKRPRSTERVVELPDARPQAADSVTSSRPPGPRPVARIPARRPLEDYPKAPAPRAARRGERVIASRTEEAPAARGKDRSQGRATQPARTVLARPQADRPADSSLDRSAQAGPAPEVSIEVPVPFMGRGNIVYRDGQTNYTPPRLS